MNGGNIQIVLIRKCPAGLPGDTVSIARNVAAYLVNNGCAKWKRVRQNIKNRSLTKHAYAVKSGG